MYDFISGPVHINRDHWALLFANLKTQTIIYIDSRGENLELRNRVLKNWAKFTNDRKTDELIKNIRWRMGVYDHVYQIDCNNCGLFVCYFFKNLIESDLA